MSFSSSGKHVLDSSSPFRRRLGPRVLNSVLVFIAFSFVAGILIGSAFQMSTKMRLMRALSVINAALDEAEATGAAVTSLLSLLPVFSEFIAAGEAVKVAGDRSCQVWACWGIIWVAVSDKATLATTELTFARQAYPPAALSLVRTLRKQQQHLQRSLNNLQEVDQLTSKPPETYRPRLNGTRTSSSSTSSPLEQDKKAVDTSGAMPLVAVELPTTAFRSNQARTAAQRDEVTCKLSAVQRIKLVLIVQLATTSLMLVEYCAVVSEL